MAIQDPTTREERLHMTLISTGHVRKDLNGNLPGVLGSAVTCGSGVDARSSSLLVRKAIESTRAKDH